MSKEIVIQAGAKETRIAILEDGALAELYVENPDNARTIGDILLGRVRNVMPSIQAAFVNIGQKQDAFLHFSDVGETLTDLLELIGEKQEVSDIDVHVPRVHRSIRNSAEYESSPNPRKKDRPGESDSKKETKGEGGKGKKDKKDKKGGKGKKGKKGEDEFIHPARYLRNGEKVLVQIVKEPIANKGSRITTHVTLAGRFLVLVPYGDYVAVSKKIWSARERKRLQALGRSLLPEGFGLIIRTVAAGKDAKTLHTDLSLLIQKWDRILEKLNSKPSPPKLLHQDVSMVSSVIRDLFTDDYDRILIDDHKLFRSIQTYVRAVAPAMLPTVQHHDKEAPIFEVVGADKAIAEAFSSRVDLPSGGYLIIEHTEAMHVIDVNSGRAGRGESQEENSLKVDLEAAEAIARQLRLRDLGGIIVVDFIDLREDRNRNKVVNRLKQEFRNDRAVTKVLPMSDFGVIQITRQRLRPSITTDEAAREAEQASAPDPMGPDAKPLAPQGVDKVMQNLDAELALRRKEGQKAGLTLTVHPFFAAYLRRGFSGKLNRLRLKHRMKITLREDESLRPTTYLFEGQDAVAVEQNFEMAEAQSASGGTVEPIEVLADPYAVEEAPVQQEEEKSERSGRGRSGRGRSGRGRSGRSQRGGGGSNRGGSRGRSGGGGGNRSGGSSSGGRSDGGSRSSSKSGKGGGSGSSTQGKSRPKPGQESQPKSTKPKGNRNRNRSRNGKANGGQAQSNSKSKQPQSKGENA